MPRFVECAAGRPLPVGLLAELGSILASGGLVVYPAGTLYGLGAGAGSSAGLERVNSLKGRPGGMPLSIMATAAQAERLCVVPRQARRFLDSGESRITMVLPAADGASAMLAADGTIGVRLPCSELARSLVESAGPVTATSANRHGAAPPLTALDAAAQLGDGAAVYLDAGRQAGVPSTVVDFTGQKPRIIREGALPSREVEER